MKGVIGRKFNEELRMMWSFKGWGIRK
jgi:hypothetical protein